LRDDRDAVQAAVRDQAARDDARLFFRAQRELIEIAGRRDRVREEVQREDRDPAGGQRCDRGDILLGQRADDEVGAVRERPRIHGCDRCRCDVVDAHPRPRRGVLLEIRREEAVPHRDAGGPGRARQR